MSGTQAHVDSERLRALAVDLARFSERIKEVDGEMQRALTKLGETFRDDEYDRFRDHFGASRRRLLEFVEDVSAVIPKLHADANDIAEYGRIKQDF